MKEESESQRHCYSGNLRKSFSTAFVRGNRYWWRWKCQVFVFWGVWGWFYGWKLLSRTCIDREVKGFDNPFSFTFTRPVTVAQWNNLGPHLPEGAPSGMRKGRPEHVSQRQTPPRERECKGSRADGTSFLLPNSSVMQLILSPPGGDKKGTKKRQVCYSGKSSYGLRKKNRNNPK